jgi:methionine sulfoxide reductase heme-binding subunit
MTRWKLFVVLSALAALITAVSCVLAPDAVQSLQYAVRATARTSFVLFLAAFTASSLAKLAPSALTRALVRERRYLGLSFAFSHLLHGVALILYIDLAPEAFWVGRTPATNIPGSIGYVMILLLTITSFNTPARWIGSGNWKRLHRIGVWFIAIIFAGSFLTRIPHSAGYVAPSLIMLAAMLLRVAARFAKAPRVSAPLS